MAVKKTLRHELTYNTETSRGTFNGRNKTANQPVHKSLPQRLFPMLSESEVVDNTLELSKSANLDVDEHTIELGRESIDEENHTINLD